MKLSTILIAGGVVLVLIPEPIFTGITGAASIAIGVGLKLFTDY
jgi:hypothetical protein